MTRVEKLRKAEQARRAEQSLLTEAQASVRLDKPGPNEIGTRTVLVPQQATVTVPAKNPVVAVAVDEPSQPPKPKKPKRPKWTPAERDAAMKGKRRYPVGTRIVSTMTGEEEWTANIVTPDGFVHVVIGPGIHTLLSKADDAYMAWLRAKETPAGEQGGV